MEDQVIKTPSPCFDLAWNWKRWRSSSLKEIVLEISLRESECREMRGREEKGVEWFVAMC